MRMILPATMLGLVLALSLNAQSEKNPPPADWEKSIVRVEVARTTYDYYTDARK